MCKNKVPRVSRQPQRLDAVGVAYLSDLVAKRNAAEALGVI